MLKKVLLAAIAAGAMIAGTAGASAQSRQKFDFWYGLTGELGDIMVAHCKRFNESQTKFEAVCTGQGGYDKAEQNTIAAFRAKQQPTLVQIYDAGTVNFMLSGAIYKASDLVKDYKMNVKWDDYFPGISNYYATSKGEMWSFPYNSSTAMYYYNKDAWAKIGKSAPPATWEEHEKDMRALKAAGYACPMAVNFDTWQLMEQFSAIHSQPIATKSNGYDGLDAELVFNKTKFVDHMKNFRKWIDEGLVQIHTPQTGKTIVQAFADGTCMSMQSSIADHGVVGVTKKEGLNWAVQPLPVYEGTKRQNSLVGGASIWIMAGKSKEEYEGAAAYLDFLAKPTEAQWFSTVTGYIPVTNSGFQAMTANGFYKEAKFAGRELAIASLTATPPSATSKGIRLGNFTSIRAEIRAELEAAFTGKKEVQAALDDAVARGNQILRRFEQTMKNAPLP
jgi:sn-glycerol 3-phosphate transport system substrate-binding protein